MPSPPSIIIGVPGTWPDQRALTLAVTSQNMPTDASGKDAFLFAGALLMEIATQDKWEVDLYGPDPRLPEAFAIAGQGAFSPEELTTIAGHTMTVYLIGAGGTPEAARKMMRATRALLRAGGIAVKIESTGKAHTADHWQELTESEDDHALFAAYVTFLYEGGNLYSCGMHNLGLPDAVISTPTPNRESEIDLEIFLLFTLLEQPELKDGHTFSRAVDATRYRLTQEPSHLYPADDPFYNPYGVWRLSPV